MSALAKYFLSKNTEVWGYDSKKTATVDDLIDKGLKFLHPDDLSLGSALIVYTSAVENTLEFSSLKERGFELIKRSELLSLVQGKYKLNFAVAGCHGKTTTTAMLAHVLISANLHPTAFIGGEDLILSNLVIGKRKVCVSEACEYKGNFLDLRRDVAIITNIDNDHLDYYGDLDTLKKAFNTFALGNIAVINSDDKNSTIISGRKTITFGINNPADYIATDITYTGGGVNFSVVHKGKKIKGFTIMVPCKHNVYNALAVISASRVKGVSWRAIKRGLASFTGVKRRNEYIGKVNGVSAYCDYAHHPTEIKNAISNITDKTVIVFQPHTYSRTATLFSEFLETLKKVNNLIVYKTYPAREKYDRQGSAKTLFEELKGQRKSNLYYARSPSEIIKAISHMDKIDRVIFLGAGDVYEIAINLTDKKEN